MELGMVLELYSLHLHTVKCCREALCDLQRQLPILQDILMKIAYKFARNSSIL